MKHFFDGIKSYIILALTASSVITIVGATLMFLFGSHNGKTIYDLVHWAWVEIYFTGTCLGGAIYKFHIVAMIGFGLINYVDNDRW